ncbi:MAG: OsmC family protein [Candidatus Heimdallarchaeota archaeon]
MKSTYKLVKNYQAIVDNGRNHATVIDLTPKGDGESLGPTALELCLMSYSGCIGTIFAKIARKMRLAIESLEVVLEADRDKEDPTMRSVNATVNVKSPDSVAKLEKCLDFILHTCPVGVLFDNADVPKNVKLNVIE